MKIFLYSIAFLLVILLIEEIQANYFKTKAYHDDQMLEIEKSKERQLELQVKLIQEKEEK